MTRPLFTLLIDLTSKNLEYHEVNIFGCHGKSKLSPSAGQVAHAQFGGPCHGMGAIYFAQKIKDILDGLLRYLKPELPGKQFRFHI